MAISTSNFTLDDVYNEFGNNTQPTHNSFSVIHNKVFGNFGEGARIGSFSGLSKPIVSSFSTSIGVGEIDVFTTIKTGGLNAEVFIEYQIEEIGENPFEGANAINRTSIQHIGVGDAVSYDITLNLSENTTYWVRVRAANSFNNAVTTEFNDWTASQAANVTTGQTPLANVDLIYAKYKNDTMYLEWNYDDSADQFEVQYADDQTPPWEDSSISGSPQNWGTTTNPKTGQFEPSSPVNYANDLQARIRAVDTSGSNESSWVLFIPQELYFAPLSRSLSQPDPYDNEVIGTWTNNETLDIEVQWQLFSGGSWSNDGSIITLSPSTTQITSNYSDGQEIRFLIRYVNGSNLGEWGASNSITMDVSLNPHPINLVASGGAGSSVLLDWDEPEAGTPDYYQIEFDDGTATGYVVLESSWSSSNYIHQAPEDEGLQYRVRSYYSSTGFSGWVYSNIFDNSSSGGGGGSGGPDNLSASQITYEDPLQVEATWDNTSTASLSIEWIINSVAEPEKGLTSNTTSDILFYQFSNGDNVQCRVRYTSGDTTWSDLSNNVTVFEQI